MNVFNNKVSDLMINNRKKSIENEYYKLKTKLQGLDTHEMNYKKLLKLLNDYKDNNIVNKK